MCIACNWKCFKWGFLPSFSGGSLKGNLGWSTNYNLPSFLFSFKFLSGSFAPLALLLTLGLCQGERRDISSEFSPGNLEQFAEMQGWAESHPGPFSPSYFHWAFLFWLQFSPHPGVKTFPGERKMQAPLSAAGWSHCPPCYWGSESVAWPLILLRHLNYSYSIRHIWRKEIGLSQVADVSAGMYDWKLIPWHRLMKTAVSWNTEIHFIFFYNTWSQCYIFSLFQSAIDILTVGPGIFHFNNNNKKNPPFLLISQMSRNWSGCLIMKILQ